ncbi:hypothetical protein [Streptomyces sp. NPDC001194]|uniref:hypothetical protein n=1 Tax=Streptomyces sp. NPDC001194 TaxID=3364547 RepID=UPI00367F59FB
MTEITSHPTEICRTLLQCIADTLIVVDPQDPMDEATRVTEAHRYAGLLHTADCSAAIATEREILALAPAVRPGTTRDEYAAQLRLAAQGVTA